ncbi:hypothetical protein [Singulisphaera sp. PoT]|uniref:hypothetical protein n=1 Tax=Singulisphaera sp. PoT TaxID=3411797 RepID=UPI003BF4F30C
MMTMKSTRRAFKYLCSWSPPPGVNFATLIDMRAGMMLIILGIDDREEIVEVFGDETEEELHYVLDDAVHLLTTAVLGTNAPVHRYNPSQN